MITLDTNLLVRLLLRDDEKQTAEVCAVIERVTAAGAKCYVTSISLVEVVWVLKRDGYTRPEISAALDYLLKFDTLQFDDKHAFSEAADAYARGKADFADYMIIDMSHTAGIDAIVSFDKQLCAENNDCFEPRDFIKKIAKK